MVDRFPLSLTTLFFHILFLLMLVKQWIRPKTRTAIQNLPPGPWKLPLIGNIHQLSSLPHRSLRDLATKHGPLMHLQLGEVSAVVISSPRLAKMVMTTHDLALANRPRLLVAETLLYRSDIGFSPYGGFLRQMRKICTEELLSARKKCRDQEVLMELMKDTTSLAGGFDLADLFPSIKLVHVVSGMKPKLMKMHRKIDDVLESIIRERRMASTEESKQREEDLLDVLLRLEKTDGFEFPITVDNIKAIIFVEECKFFFQTLYKFVYLLGTYLKPHVAILDGITMGDDPSVIEDSLAQYGDLVYPNKRSILHKIEAVDKCFSQDTVEEIIDAPFSSAIRYEKVGFNLWTVVLFGVRARLVDKDFAPKWVPSSLGEVTKDMVDYYFAPLDESELELDLPTALREPSV
ncbi:Premnaspirodiene oxygenase [Camellia lanceoleosa]|uniref:Premnaspirodiene oxygenase n=1 Tax=Camellia lanceoleosa TaxID=1840588 RepID=A0ACC0FJR4_9ERIC|nr:Premnaspirodiene oxygenase [Camellia lanceoleosa]